MRRVWVIAGVGFSAVLGCGGRSSLDWWDVSSGGASSTSGGRAAAAGSVGSSGTTSHAGTFLTSGAGGAAGGVTNGGTAGTGGSAIQCAIVSPMPSPADAAVDVPVTTPISLGFACDDATPIDQLPYVLELSAPSGDVAGMSRLGKGPASGTLELVPKEPLALHTTYTVSLRDGAVTKYSWHFTTLDGGWRLSEPVATLQGQDQTFAFAVNDLGAGIIAYSEEDPASNDTSVNTQPFDVERGLSGATFGVTSNRFGDFHQLSVALNTQRDAVVGWLEYTGKYAVEVARKQGDQAWQPLQTVAGPANYGVELSALAVSATGSHLALWRENGGNLGAGDALRLLDLDQQNAPMALASNVGGAHAALVPERGGGVWALWDAPEVTVRHLSSAGSWGKPKTFGKETWSGQSSPGAVLAASPDGSAMLLIPEQIGGKHTLSTWQFLPDTGWLDRGKLDTEGDKGVSDATYPALALDASGNALAVWTMSQTYVTSQVGNVTTYATDWELRAQRFSKDTGWEAAHQTLVVGPATIGSVGLDDSGDGFVLASSVRGIQALRWLGGSEFQPTALTSSSIASTPQLVVTRRGTAAALWREAANLVIRRFYQ